MVFCTKCGKENQNESLYCYNCGARLIHDDVVEDIKTSINDSGNENLNYQNTENPLINKNKTQKGPKYSFMPILDIITNISIIIFFLALIGTCIIVFTGLCENYSIIIYSSFFLSLLIIVIASIISDGAKEVSRQKVMNTGIPAQARILNVNNL